MTIGHLRFALWVALALAVFGGTPASSGEYQAGEIEIKEPWVRETPIGGTSGGGYMRINNAGSEADRLVRAESKAAKRVELRQAVMNADTLKMRVLSSGMEIPAGTTVTFRWDAYHLFFFDLVAPFKAYDSVEVELHFAKSGPVKVRFDVQPRVYW